MESKINPDHYNLLTNSELTKYLSREELEMIFNYSETITFSANETILDQGKKSPGLYIIISGTVISTAKVMGEGITQLESFTTGNFLGKISFIENIPSPVSIITSSETHCLYITKTFFDFLSLYYPMTKYHLLRAITVQACNRLKLMHDKIAEFIIKSDMIEKLSFIGKVMDSFTKPEKISFENTGITVKQLQQQPPFNLFTHEEMEGLLQHVTAIKIPKHYKLIHKADKALSCYIVLYGAVQSSLEINNKIAKLSVIGPNTLFASSACIDKNSEFTVTFTSCEKAILLYLSEIDMSYLQNNIPTLWYKIFNLICHSLLALEKSINKLDVRLYTEQYNR